MNQAIAQTVSFGLKGGVAFSHLSGRASEVWQGTTGSTGGAFVALRVHGRLALQVEASLTQKDVFKRDATSGSVEWTDRLSALYLEVPILVRYAIPIQPARTGLFLMAGLAPAFAVSCQDTATPRLLTGAGPLPETYRYECARLLTYPDSPEITGVMGVAGHVHIGGLPFILDIRYASGLFDIGESTFKRGTNFAQHHNVTLAASLGLLLGGSH